MSFRGSLWKCCSTWALVIFIGESTPWWLLQQQVYTNSGIVNTESCSTAEPWYNKGHRNEVFLYGGSFYVHYYYLGKENCYTIRTSWYRGLLYQASTVICLLYFQVNFPLQSDFYIKLLWLGNKIGSYMFWAIWGLFLIYFIEWCRFLGW